MQLNEWLSINKMDGEGNAELTLTASSNEEFEARLAMLKIEGIYTEKYVSVEQKPFSIDNKYFWVEFESTGAQLRGLTNSVVNFSYSFDGETWETAPSTLSMGENKKVYLQNSTKTLRTDSVTTSLKFSTYAKIGGDMSSIVDMAEVCCGSVFSYNTYLTDASNLVLPWETLERSCFANMFVGCTKLQYPPIIKATKLRAFSCLCMFQGCTSLLRTPILLTPSNNFIPRGAYSGMFKNCTSLIEACDLNALDVNDEGYYEMFYECTSLETAPYINAESLSYSTENSGQHMQSMFQNCKKLTNVQSVLKPNILEKCYRWMYRGCSSLKTAPALPQNTLRTECYYGMFQGCTSLIYVKMLGSGNYEETYVNGAPKETPLNWFLYGVNTQGTFVKHPNSTLTVDAPTGGGIPPNWTVETATE